MSNNYGQPAKPPKPGFPASTPVLRRALARDDICPECGDELDTGFECNNCGYDAQAEATSFGRQESGNG